MHQPVLRLCVRDCPIPVLLTYVGEDTRWLVDLVRDPPARVRVQVSSLRLLRRMIKIVREADHPHENERESGLDPNQEREREAEAEAEAERDITADIGIARCPPPKMRRKLNAVENVDENDAVAVKRKNSLMIALWTKLKKTREMS